MSVVLPVPVAAIAGLSASLVVAHFHTGPHATAVAGVGVGVAVFVAWARLGLPTATGPL